jgi:hypothetical protein
MSPDERAAQSTLARLRSEIADDRAAMKRCLRDLDEARALWARSRDDRAATTLGAYAIHGWYTALEAIFERTARALDGDCPSGTSWHRDLLSQASTTIASVRPEIVPRALLADLTRLLNFRHFFRHGYGAELDVALVETEATRLDTMRGRVDAALDAFLAFLDGAQVP